MGLLQLLPTLQMDPPLPDPHLAHEKCPEHSSLSQQHGKPALALTSCILPCPELSLIWQGPVLRALREALGAPLQAQV